MKKNKILFLIGILLMAMNTSCDDDLADELFTKYTYITNNGWKEDISLSIEENDMGYLPLDLGVSGTSRNGKDITIKLAVDPDTLQAYNEERFKNLTDKYFKILPAESYTFDSEDIKYKIKSGKENTRAVVAIDLNILRNIDVYEEYVLPVRITESQGEIVGPGRYSTLLAKIGFNNEYSGIYTGKGEIKYKSGIKDIVEGVTTCTMIAIGSDDSFIYAGNANRQSENAKTFIINVRLNEDNSLTLSALEDKIKLIPMNAQLKRTYRLKDSDNRYYIENAIVDLKYSYIDPSDEIETVYTYEASLSKVTEVLKEDYPNVEVIID